MKPPILIIDDAHDILRAFKRALKNENFSIYTTSRSKNTMRLIVEKKPKIVIMNFKVDGRDNVEKIRQIKRVFPRLPVVIMTAYSNIFTEKDALKFGADAYLTKPFEINTMLLTLNKLVDSPQA